MGWPGFVDRFVRPGFCDNPPVRFLAYLIAFLLVLGACSDAEPQVLRLATTTSTYDSGLLDAILPDFEERFGAKVEVVAVGTGQALALGEAGDADVVLVHARAREEAFVAAGHGVSRHDVMYNDFVIVGSPDDPAGVQGTASVVEALTAIASADAPCASRGDECGTHSKEMSLWALAGITPEGRWYKSIGQGMGATLEFSEETSAYTLTDRGTFLAQRANLAGLEILFGGDSISENPDQGLRNPYGVIAVDPSKSGVAGSLAVDFVTWLTSVETQELIAAFATEGGETLFYPDSAEWRSR